jgi:hypothetical protein
MAKGGDIPPTTKKVREKSCSWATWSFSTLGTIGVFRGSKAYSRRCAPYISRASFGGWLLHVGGYVLGSPTYFRAIFSGCRPYILGVSHIFSGHVFMVCPLYFWGPQIFSEHIFGVPYVSSGPPFRVELYNKVQRRDTGTDFTILFGPLLLLVNFRYIIVNLNNIVGGYKLSENILRGGDLLGQLSRWATYSRVSPRCFRGIF